MTLTAGTGSTGSTGRAASGNMALLLGLIVLGWSYALAQLLSVDARGSLAEAGVGMEVFAYAKATLFDDPFAFETSLSLCTTPSGAWGSVDVMKASAMWASMILAMMLPVLVPELRRNTLDPAPFPAFIGGLFGYGIAWVPFCVAGVAVQWWLQGAGYLDAHHVLRDVGPSAAVLGLVALIHLSGLSRSGVPRRAAFCARVSCSHPVREGWRYGLGCLRCCGPLMLVMFSTGLMNVLAMLLLSGLMVMEMSGPHRRVSSLVGVTALLAAICTLSA